LGIIGYANIETNTDTNGDNDGDGQNDHFFRHKKNSYEPFFLFVVHINIIVIFQWECSRFDRRSKHNPTNNVEISRRRHYLGRKSKKPCFLVIKGHACDPINLDGFKTRP
jgi:hypothetical protein